MHRHIAALVCLVAFGFAAAFAQAPLAQPQASPKAVVSQTIGVSDVTISYHRPGVKARTIWGGLVPYGEVWRGGANENTTITFSDPVKVNGKDLPAGTYGLHFLPAKGEWTVIFSKNSTSWGSYSYNSQEDALRLSVVPQEGPLQEWLAYQFDDLSATSAVASLRWEKLVIPFKLEFDSNALVVANARNAYLRGTPGFTWQGWYNAANFCAQKGVNLDEALTWVERSITMNENTQNTLLKATLLSKLNRVSDAEAARARAEAVACTESDLNQAGNAYLNAGKTKEGLQILNRNVKNHEESWSAHFNLAEGYAKAGEKKRALESYERALKLVKDADDRARVTSQMEKVKEK